jgi:hypothetical protein
LPNGLTHAYLARVHVQGRTGSGWGSKEQATKGSPLDEREGTHLKELGAVSYITTLKGSFLVNIAH